MAYLYRHIRLDKNQPFYIGIGSDNLYKRAKETRKRNNYWNSIVQNSKYEIEILLDNLTWDEACKKEIEFISIYGRKNNNTGILANMTDGGEGGLGVIFSEENRNKLIERNKGNDYYKFRKPIIISEERRAAISKAFKGSNHPRYGKKKELNEIYKSIKTKGCKPFKVYKDGLYINEYLSQAECARDLSINRCAINMCLKGKREKTCGYAFIYSENYLSNVVTRK